MTMRSEEKPPDYPRDVLAFFRQLHDSAKAGQVVDVGGISEFKAGGLLGDPNFMAMTYIHVGGGDPTRVDPKKDSSRDAEEAARPQLAAIALTGDELAALKTYGLTRVMASLGNQYRYYPCPYWVERGRASSITKVSNESSILAKMPRLAVPGIRVLLQSDLLTVRLPRSARDPLRQLAADLRKDLPLALLTELDPEATGCLIWHAGADGLQAITSEGGDGSLLTGAFVALVPGQSQDTVDSVEDGFKVSLTNASFERLRKTLKAGTALSLPGRPGQPRLELQWDAEEAKDSASDWPGQVAGVHLLLADAELKQRLGGRTKPLADYIRTLVRATSAYWKKAGPPEVNGLLIAVGIKPGKKARVWVDGVEGSILVDDVERMQAQLGAIPTIEVNHGPVAFTIKLAFPEKAVKSFPKFPFDWEHATSNSKEPLEIPDELFKVIWPD